MFPALGTWGIYGYDFSGRRAGTGVAPCRTLQCRHARVDAPADVGDAQLRAVNVGG
jgi:hypothetical protein